MSNILVFFCLIALFFSCKTIQNSSVELKNSPEPKNLEASNCNGTVNSFSLISLPNHYLMEIGLMNDNYEVIVNTQELGLPAFTTVTNFLNNNIVIRICLDDDDNVELLDVTLKAKTEFNYEEIEIYKNQETTEVNDLKKTVFSEGRELFINISPNKEKSFYIKEYKGAIFAGLATKTPDNQWKIEPSDPWFAGKFAFGDFTSDSLCQPGEFLQYLDFKIFDAQFLGTNCIKPVGDFNAFYTYINLEVKDPSDKLPPEIRGKTFSFDKEKIKNILVFKNTHHNANDTFTLTLPHAKYELLWEGCAETKKHKHFPIKFREIQRVQYGNNPVMEKTIKLEELAPDDECLD